MKIIDRYMARGFAGPFIWCLFIFIIMGVIIDIFSFIDDIVKYKIPAASIWAFYVHYSPTIFIQVTPMAVLLSSIYVLSNLNKHNEITAMKSSGISLWRILLPLLIIGFLISMAVFVVNDRIIPPSSRKAGVIRRDELEKEKRKHNPAKIENVAVYGAGNRIIFARNYDTRKAALGDIIIHQHDATANLTSKITAQTGAWTAGEGWRFSRVLIYKIDNAGRILGEPEFYSDTILPLKEKPDDFANREWRSDYMSYNELKRYIRNFRGTGNRLVKNLLVDLHYKIAFPLISLIIILVGAPFAIITTRGGVLIGIGMSIAIGLLYYASIAISLAFGKAGIFPPMVAAWFGNVAFAILGIHLINKRT